MAQIDSNATPEQIAQMELEFARKRLIVERERVAELARLSDVRVTVGGRGTTWTYVVVDGSFVRILSCSTEKDLLSVPGEIEGLPVREFGPEALSGLHSVQEIVCPDGVEAIGAYAFRSCESLRRLVLPKNTASFSGGWISLCPIIEELVLPDALEVITSDVLANPALRRLAVGRCTQVVEPGAFERSQLDVVVIDERNAHLKTDGTCIYSADGQTLIALVRPARSYRIAQGCRRIAKKAFSRFGGLEQVSMPESLEIIDELAFARSGIVSIDCPRSLRTIGPRAFLGCKSLESVSLSEGLRSIDDRAFANTALCSLRVPSSVDVLGPSICEKSKVRFSGDDATFSIDLTNPVYAVDGQGCLYRTGEDGVHLSEMLDPCVKDYVVRADARAIDERAFAYHSTIERVVLPEGLERIGTGAFRVCRKLRHVSIPASLKSVGADAFLDTSLESFRIPLGLDDIGSCALVTDGAHHEGPKPALRAIEVVEGHERFFMHTGMLCRRKTAGTSIVVFTNSCESVDFPGDTVEVEDYAFNNAFGIRNLHLNAQLRTIGACGLSVMSQIRTVRIDVAQPIEGISSFVLRFPDSTHSVHGFLLALGGLGHLYMPDIMAQYDSFIAASRDYHAPDKGDNASAYEQAQLIIERLNSSVLLTEANRRRYHLVLVQNLEEICVDIARHDDRASLGQLADLGVLNAGNIENVINAVGMLQDAAMTGYLLEMNRLRFSGCAVDFDL